MKKRKRLPKTVLCSQCDLRFASQRAGRGLRKIQICPRCGNEQEKKKSLSDIKSETWQLFAWYIKLRDSDDQGISGVCCTCGERVWLGTKQCQAGHFLHGRTKGVLYEERCVHLQCDRCNVFMGGNPDAYWPFMMRTYGNKVIDELIDLQKKYQGPWTIDELREIADYYENKTIALGYGALWDRC